MKSITITFLSLLMTTVVFAQEVKNISYSQDSLGYKILVTYKGGNVQAVPQDSVGLDGIEYPKRLTYNELIEHIVDQNLFKAEEVYRQTALNIIDLNTRDKIEKEYNKLLKQVTGKNYQQYLMDFQIDSLTTIADTYAGYYVIAIQDTFRVLELRKNGKIRQVTTKGQAIDNGFTGKWAADSRDGFTLSILKGEAIIVDKIKFVRSRVDVNVYLSLNYSPIQLIGKTQEELKLLK